MCVNAGADQDDGRSCCRMQKCKLIKLSAVTLLMHGSSSKEGAHFDPLTSDVIAEQIASYRSTLDRPIDSDKDEWFDRGERPKSGGTWTRRLQRTYQTVAKTMGEGVRGRRSSECYGRTSVSLQLITEAQRREDAFCRTTSKEEARSDRRTLQMHRFECGTAHQKRVKGVD
jgi:hypothetical protein